MALGNNQLGKHKRIATMAAAVLAGLSCRRSPSNDEAAFLRDKHRPRSPTSAGAVSPSAADRAQSRVAVEVRHVLPTRYRRVRPVALCRRDTKGMLILLHTHLSTVRHHFILEDTGIGIVDRRDSLRCGAARRDRSVVDVTSNIGRFRVRPTIEHGSPPRPKPAASFAYFAQLERIGRLEDVNAMFFGGIWTSKVIYVILMEGLTDNIGMHRNGNVLRIVANQNNQPLIWFI